MSDDIVTRLNEQAKAPALVWLADAAAEIEALRAAGDALAAVLRSGSDTGWDAAIDEWEETRRG